MVVVSIEFFLSIKCLIFQSIKFIDSINDNSFSFELHNTFLIHTINSIIYFNPLGKCNEEQFIHLANSNEKVFIISTIEFEKYTKETLIEVIKSE